MMEDEKEKLREDQDEQIVNDAFQHLLDCYLASRLCCPATRRGGRYRLYHRGH